MVSPEGTPPGRRCCHCGCRSDPCGRTLGTADAGGNPFGTGSRPATTGVPPGQPVTLGAMSTKIRFGIVGTGGIANTHAAGLAALGDDAELVAVCDVDPTRVGDFAERWGVQHQYPSARTMLDAGQIDVVCVCTPHPQHADPLVLAAERGIHGVVEKPLAATLADADRVLEAAAKHGTMISTMAQRRWFPAAQRVRKAIDEGKMGPRLLLGESVTEMWRDAPYYQKDAWRGRWDTEGGGVLMNQAPHNIDFLLWFMGPAEEIFGYWANLNHPYVEIEDKIPSGACTASPWWATRGPR